MSKNLNRAAFLVILFICCFSFCSHAKERKVPAEYSLRVEVRDNLTRRVLQGAQVNVKVKTDSLNLSKMGMTRDEGEAVIPEIPAIKKYTITVSYRPWQDEQKLWEYEKETVEFEVKDPCLKTQDVGTIYLKHKRHKQLKEVEVTASKVMFYYKGDTLIYNADAFILAEGSMLDGLISQMPGVTLDRKGRIKVNGREVNSLLLNGKDLFNGNKQLMLENIGAYTVKDIAVYNKNGFEGEALGINSNVQYVMDVRLKRQYKHGFLGNVEAGYGTDNRYRAKAFGMWYSDNIGMTAFLSSNNLNDDAKPKPGYSDGSWSDLNPSTGTGSMHSGGITYNAEGTENKWQIRGDAIARYADGTVSQRQNHEVLIPGNEMWQYSWQNSRTKDFSVNTAHTLKASAAKRAVFTVAPRFDYSRRRSEDSYLSASFNNEIEDISRSVIENIYGSEEYSQYMLNRNLQYRLGRENRTAFNVDASSLIKLHRNDGNAMLTLGGAARVDNQHFNTYTFRQLNFPAYPEDEYSALQHTQQDPYRDREYRGYAHFSQSLGFWNARLNVDYDFTRTEQTRTSLLFQDDLAQDYLTPSMLPGLSIGLPLDAAESYFSNQWENRHALKAHFGFQKRNKDYRKFTWGSSIDLPLTVSQRNLDYRRGENKQHFRSTKFLPEINASIFGQWQPLNLYRFTLNFSSSPHQPQMLNMVDVIDNTDPMHIRFGNPNLADTRTNKFSLNFAKQGRNPHHELDISYSNTRNAISQGFYYFLNTGQSISRPYNVDGNHSAKISYRFSWWKEDKFWIDNTLSASYQRSCELIGSAVASDADFDFGVAPPTNRVDNFTYSDNISGEFKFGGKYTLKPFAKLTLRQYRSPNSAINKTLTFGGSYGASALLNLPRNWGVSTDLTLYTRRGYMDARLNTTDVLWNARLTKSFLKGSMVCVLEAYDLLRQLSNVSYTVNAQYRTETVTNVIPAYFLLSVQYRFNKQPKK